MEPHHRVGRHGLGAESRPGLHEHLALIETGSPAVGRFSLVGHGVGERRFGDNLASSGNLSGPSAVMPIGRSSPEYTPDWKSLLLPWVEVCITGGCGGFATKIGTGRGPTGSHSKCWPRLSGSIVTPYMKQ